MAKQKSENTYLKFLKPVTLGFADLVTPTRYKDKGDLFYRAQFLLGSQAPDLESIRNACKELALKKWDSLTGVSFPVVRGEILDKKYAANHPEKECPPLYGDAYILKAKSAEKYPPRLCVAVDGKGVDFDQRSNVDAEKYGKAFYFGVRVLGKICLSAVETVQGKFVTAYVNEVVSLNKGERKMGGSPTGDSYSDIIAADYEAGVSSSLGQSGVVAEEEPLW